MPIPDAEEKAALAECQSALSNAQDACAAKDEDYSSTLTDSLTGSCTDMQNVGLASAKTKNDQAKTCQSAWTNCVQSCGTSADKYTENDDWSTFNSASRACSVLSTKAKALLDASTQSQKASGAGMDCLSNASESASSKKDDKAANAAASAAAAAGTSSEQCLANPGAPGCAATPEYATALAATGGFNTVDTDKSGGDVTDTSSLIESGFPGAAVGGGAAPAKVSPIANNTGGGIPGGGGGSNSGGGKNGAGGVMGMISSAITDIEKGFLSAVGLSPPAEPAEKVDETTAGAETPAQEAAKRKLASLEETKYLQRLLPDGDLFKKRAEAAATFPTYHAPHVDLFSRITVRMQERCARRVLLGCEHGLETPP